MSKKGKILAGLGLLLLFCLVVWAVRTAPEPPPKQELQETAPTMTYDENTLSEEKDGKKVWELNSEKMDVDVNTKDVALTKVTAHFYGEDGRQVNLTADSGKYTNATRDIETTGNVIVTTNDGATLTSDKLIWTDKEGKLTAQGNAYIKHEDMQARADTIESTNEFNHFKATGNAHIDKGVK